MNTPLKIGSFVAGLVAVFAMAFGVGKVFDDGGGTDDYQLRLITSQRGSTVKVRLAVLDSDDVVKRFAVRHEKRLHLIAVTKDFDVYRHLHPTMDAKGEWTVDSDLRAGEWRVFADFQPVGGDPEVLNADFGVNGTYRTLTPEGGEDEMPRDFVDDYSVNAVGSLTAGGNGSTMTFDVSDADGPVTDLQPYLGAYGHLVVLREKDMKYLHVHPEDGPPGPGITFHVEVPTAVRYRLFLDFKHGNEVHTARFILDATEGASDDHSAEMDHDEH